MATWESTTLSDEPVAGFLDLVRRLDANVSPGSKRSLQGLVRFYANDEEGSTRAQLDRMAAGRPMSEALAALGRGSRMMGRALEAEGDAEAAAAWGQIDAAMGSTYEELRALGGADAAVAEMDYEAAIADVDQERLQRRTGLDENVVDAVMRPLPTAPPAAERRWPWEPGAGRPGTEALPEAPGLGDSTPWEGEGFRSTVGPSGSIVYDIPRVPGTVGYEGSVSETLRQARPEPGELGAPTSRSLSLGASIPGIAEGTPSDLRRESPVFAGGDIDDILGKPGEPTPRTAEEEAAIAGLLGAEGEEDVALSDLVGAIAGATGVKPDGSGLASPQGGTPGGDAAPATETAADGSPGGGMTGKSLGASIIGGIGIAAAIGNSIADFRTTQALERQLAASAAGDTIARREGALAGSQAQRNIMATSMGRRDISPALALRNAQMAGSRALSDVYGMAAIESARERRESEAALADLRKRRWNTLFGGLAQTAGTVGSLLATEGAKTEVANKKAGSR